MIDWHEAKSGPKRSMRPTVDVPLPSRKSLQNLAKLPNQNDECDILF